MVISSLNIPRILDLIRLIENYLSELRPFASMTKEAFLSDKKNPPFVESYLRRSLEAVFDIGRHVLAKTYGSRGIEYKAIAMELGEKAVITTELADLLVEMAGYRNRMVHFYREVTPDELYDIITHNLHDFDRFIREIVLFIREYEANKPS
ncbi:MAG: DUF86 domain-containing protein [Syntrophaceae bacterium]|nr:DUF86 domain-containing protein [Pseudomonadota bacterium]MCG2739924.1 DUF86 domain-containing protein [Syntrophaceae bacterium]